MRKEEGKDGLARMKMGGGYTPSFVTARSIVISWAATPQRRQVRPTTSIKERENCWGARAPDRCQTTCDCCATTIKTLDSTATAFGSTAALDLQAGPRPLDLERASMQMQTDNANNGAKRPL